MALNLGGIGQSFAAGNVGKRYFDAYYRARTYQDQKAKLESQNQLKLQQMQLQKRGLDLQEKRLGMEEKAFQAKQAQTRQELKQREQLQQMISDQFGVSIPGSGDAGRATGTTRTDTGPIKSPPPALTGIRADFYNDTYSAAQQAASQLGISPEILMAQSALETGYGKSLSGGQNYFGIKSHGRKGGKNVNTKEYINGKWVTVNDAFRGYESAGDSFDDYVRFLNENPRYKQALQVASQGDDEGFVRALQQAGYATDPEYANKILNIAKDMRGGIPQDMGQDIQGGIESDGPVFAERTGNFYDDLADDLGAVAAGAMDAGVTWFKDKLGQLQDRALATGDIETARDIAEAREQMVGEDAQGNIIALPDSQEVAQLQQQQQPVQPRVTSRKEVTSAVMNFANQLESLEGQRAQAVERLGQTRQQAGLDLMAATTGDISRFPAAQRQAQDRVTRAEDAISKIDDKIFAVRDKMAKASTKVEADAAKMEEADWKMEKLKAETKIKQGQLEAQERINFAKPVTSTMTKDTDDIIKNIDSYGKFLGSADDEFFATVTGLETEAKIRDAIVERFGANSPRIQWWKDYDIFKNQIRNQLFGSALTATENEIFNASNINKATNPQLAKEYLRRQLSMSLRAIRTNADKLVAETNDNFPGVGRMMGHLEPIAMLDDRIKRAGSDQEAIAQAQNYAANALYDFMSNAGITDPAMIMSTAEDLFANKAELKRKYLGGSNGRTMETGASTANPAKSTTPGISIEPAAPADPAPIPAPAGPSGLDLGAGA